MLKLSKLTRDNNINGDFCSCRPQCKSCGQGWTRIHDMSAEVLKNKPLHKCFRRWSKNVSLSNNLPPLFGRTRNEVVRLQKVQKKPANDEDAVKTPFLRLAQMAKELGAWDAVTARCAFCRCSGCCICDRSVYEPTDESRDKTRRRDMRDFDSRIKRDCRDMRIMYDQA